MTARILDGKAIALKLKQHVKQKIARRLHNKLAAPGLAVILVGDNPASQSYVSHKQQACQEVGIRSHCHRLPTTTTQQEITDLIVACNQDPAVNGILLQLPLPAHIHAQDLLNLIDPRKDVDGFHPHNMGQLALRCPTLRPCTPFGVMHLLQSTGIDLVGQHAVVVGASNIVGRPMALELLMVGCTVTICHRFTHDLAQHVPMADLLVSATGKPGIVQSDWIKPESIVIDVGFSRLDNGKIVGDIDFDTAQQRAAWITPVPGGVGQMTVATLMENTVLATELQDSLPSSSTGGGVPG